MTETQSHVRLRKPCPCGKGQIITVYHAPLMSGEEGYFLSPQIVCPNCVYRYRAHYHAHPDRAVLTPVSNEEGANRTVTYFIQVEHPAHPAAVDHA